MIDKIKQLKEKRNGVILAHNYQLPEVQDIADYVGDSLGLSRTAAASKADVVVFCGVYFMAETASILCPDKTILIPEKEAGCPMVDMAPTEKVRQTINEYKSRFPDIAVVTYVNSSAEVKAESDYCCTSANAVEIVRSIDPERKILFLPDQYLGTYAAAQTGRDLILYEGFCPTHAQILRSDLLKKMEQYPEALVMAHPECTPEVTKLADEVLSTSGMLRMAKKSAAKIFIICTETGIIHRMNKENPGKQFHAVSSETICPNMKKINLEKIIRSLEDMTFEVRVPNNIRLKARKAVDRMVEALGE